MPNINAAYRWCIDQCNNPNVGYWMDHRYQETIDGITYYDCSSFMWYSLVDGGGFVLPSPAFVTGGMLRVLTDAGFNIITGPGAGTICYPGDILWHNHGAAGGHTEMVFAGGTGTARTMGAHGRNGIPLQNQVSINAGYVPFSDVGWEYLARWGAGVEYNWHNKNTGAYSRDSIEAQENVMKMVEVLAPLGWTINAIAALAGNQAYESGFNPWRWESDTVNMARGYGLFQYTPASKYINSSVAAGYTGFQPNYPMGSGGPDDGTAQLLFMHNNVDGGYIPTSAYPLSMQAFRESTQSPDYLASAWLYNYERPADPSATEAGRRADALWWYDWLVNHPWVSHGSNIIPKRRALLNHRKRRLGY